MPYYTTSYEFSEEILHLVVKLIKYADKILQLLIRRKILGFPYIIIHGNINSFISNFIRLFSDIIILSVIISI